jgi:hypothetical protein
MKNLKKSVMMAVLLVTILMLGSLAHALPTAEFRYVETNLNNGTWQYDYTLYNRADPVTDAGYNIYDAMIKFDGTATYTGNSLPVGWDNFVGLDSTLGFGFTQIAAPFDGSLDLAPGASLSGLSFTLDYQAGNLAFDVYFTNPTDPDQFPLPYAGRTTPEGSTPVPEPSTMLLLSAGIGGLLFARRRMTRG